MAKGSPDWFGIAQFPQYGAIARVDDTLSVGNTGVETTLFEISDKGYITGGGLAIGSIPDEDSAVVLKAYLDGDLMVDFTVTGYFDYLGEWYSHSLFEVIAANRVGTYIHFGVRSGFSFSQSFKLTLLNPIATGGNCAAFWEIFYYQIV